MINLGKRIYEILGGYTLESKSVDKNSGDIIYELESIIPNEKILQEFLETAAIIQNEKSNDAAGSR